jgi:hypothetical protein
LGRIENFGAREGPIFSVATRNEHFPIRQKRSCGRVPRSQESPRNRGETSGRRIKQFGAGIDSQTSVSVQTSYPTHQQNLTIEKERCRVLSPTHRHRDRQGGENPRGWIKKLCASQYVVPSTIEAPAKENLAIG